MHLAANRACTAVVVHPTRRDRVGGSVVEPASLPAMPIDHLQRRCIPPDRRPPLPPREKRFLLASAPPSKITVTLGYTFDWFSADIRAVRFDEVVLIDWLDTEDVYEAAVTLDASLGFAIGEHLRLIVGAENILNTYPTQQDTETETGGLWDAVQMGSSGTLYFAELGLRL